MKPLANPATQAAAMDELPHLPLSLILEQPLSFDHRRREMIQRSIRIDGIKYKPCNRGKYADLPIYFHKGVDFKAGEFNWSKVTTLRRFPVDPERGGKVFQLNNIEYVWNKTGLFKGQATREGIEEVKGELNTRYFKEILVAKITPAHEAKAHDKRQALDLPEPYPHRSVNRVRTGTAQRQAIKEHTGITSKRGRRHWTQSMLAKGKKHELQKIYDDHGVPKTNEPVNTGQSATTRK